jgi:ABC-type glycerol-3-phosphate transport system substrate-binding protein
MANRSTTLLGITVVAVMIAACSSPGASVAPSTPASAVASAGSAPASATPVPEPVALRFQSLAWQEPVIATNKAIVDAWNAANPLIQVEYVQGDWGSVHDQLVTQLQSGTAPDLIHDESADIAAFSNQGFLADLKPLLSEGFKNSISPGVWESVTYKNDGWYGAPFLLQSYVVFANGSLLSAAGVTPPTIQDPWTWDDFKTAAATLTTGTQTGVGWPLKNPTATVMSLSLGYDGGFFYEEGGKTVVKFGPAEQEVLRRMHDMIYVDKSIDETSVGLGGGDILPGFFGGTYAMIVGGNYQSQQMIEQAPEGFEWIMLPPLKGNSQAQAANPQTISIATSSEHPAEAAKFIEFFLNGENLAKLATGDYLIPTTTEAGDAILASTGGADGWDVTIASGKELTLAPFQTVESYPQWKDQVATPAFQEYFANSIDLETLGTKLVDGWAQIAP